MKKSIIITVFAAVVFLFSAFISDNEKPTTVLPSVQRTGDAAAGYNYLITGDYLKSGIPYQLYLIANKRDSLNLLNRTGLNKDIAYNYTVVKAFNGELIVAPNCLQCHAEMFNGKLIVGLGNNSADFTNSKSSASGINQLYGLLKMNGGKKFEAAGSFLIASKTITPLIQTMVRGVNVADRIAAVLAAHRNPTDFIWTDSATLSVNPEVVPTDVPAWWLLKKKNAMFYNGFGRGDFTKFLMASNLLTVKDTAESRDVYNHFNDVLSFIYSIKPPVYPLPVDEQLSAKGKKLFEQNCAPCHGTYGEEGQYPNLLIPASIIKTDTALYSSNYSSPQFIDWFNKSWFTQGDNPAQLVPYKGYMAPPLDGVWITAPYLHNGSVPTLDALLNSKTRPVYWSRDFDHPVYDYDKVGWKYTISASPEKGYYNTTVPGYTNNGHYFGDKLRTDERKAVIEYLKTL